MLFSLPYASLYRSGSLQCLALKLWGYWWCFPVEVPAGFIWRQHSSEHWLLWLIFSLSLFFLLLSPCFPFIFLYSSFSLLLLLSPPTAPLLFFFSSQLPSSLFSSPPSHLCSSSSLPLFSFLPSSVSILFSCHLPFFPVSLSGLPVSFSLISLASLCSPSSWELELIGPFNEHVCMNSVGIFTSDSSSSPINNNNNLIFMESSAYRHTDTHI